MPRDLYRAVATVRDPTTGFMQALADVRVYVYAAGTTTPVNIYQAATGATQGPVPGSGASGGPNPFTTGITGQIEFYVDSPVAYDVKIEDTIAPARIATQTHPFYAESTVDNSIPGTKLVDASIATGKLADGAVTSQKIADLGIATGDIANAAVTLAKLATSSVDSSKIVDGSIASGDIADGAVGLNKIPDNVLTLAKMALGHGMGYNVAGWGGDQIETWANETDVLTSVNFNARTTAALIIAVGTFKEVRGGIGYGRIIADISGVSNTANQWVITGGWGGFGLAVHHAVGLTPGAVYTARVLSAVYNEPVTMKCWGNATVIVFDMAD